MLAEIELVVADQVDAAEVVVPVADDFVPLDELQDVPVIETTRMNTMMIMNTIMIRIILAVHLPVVTLPKILMMIMLLTAE